MSISTSVPREAGQAAGQAGPSLNDRFDEGLFPEPPAVKLLCGSRVRVQTIWGNEGGTVSDVLHDRNGYPMAQVEMDTGDTVSINIARLTLDAV